MKAAIYCRVSTLEQEKEGTSLDSQLEACLAKAKELGYETSPQFIFQESFSGLTLDRPALNDVRRLVDNKEVETVIAYTLDRLSRDPVHFIIFQQGLERAGVELILVTETVDSSDLGRLVTYIKGYAAKLEAEKIRERTTRGRRTRVEKFGKLPTGRGVLYGFTYDKEAGINIANDQLDIIRMAGMWIIGEGISLNEVCRRLMQRGIPAPKGGLRWSRSTIGRILRNPTYAGKTYAFKTVTKDKKRIPRPASEQVEIPDAVDKTAFTWEEWLVIQKQLDRNRELSPRNQKLTYLLRGMVYCSLDGYRYYGIPMHNKPYYRCGGRKALMAEPCKSGLINAQQLEEGVWAEISKALRNPQLIMIELEKRKKAGTTLTHLQERMKQNQVQLDAFDKAVTRLLRLYGIGAYTEERLKSECGRIEQERERILQENTGLERDLQEAQELIVDQTRINQVCTLVSQNIDNLTGPQKRLILEALKVKVWIEGKTVTIRGMIPIPSMEIVSQPL